MNAFEQTASPAPLSPFFLSMLAEYVAWKRLPDGRVAAVEAMLFGKFRLVTDLDEGGYRHAY